MPRKKNSVPKNKQSLPPTKVKKRAPKPKVSRVPKTRNANSMTEASFWGMIKAALRAKSRYWKPGHKVKLAARRDYKGPNPRQRFEYQCNACKEYFPEKGVQIDHIIPVGSLQCAEDLAGIIERLFVEEGGYQILCTTCHTKKSQIDIQMIKDEKQRKRANNTSTTNKA